VNQEAQSLFRHAISRQRSAWVAVSRDKCPSYITPR